jgi:hypothetical protein
MEWLRGGDNHIRLSANDSSSSQKNGLGNGGNASAKPQTLTYKNDASPANVPDEAAKQ